MNEPLTVGRIDQLTEGQRVFTYADKPKEEAGIITFDDALGFFQDRLLEAGDGLIDAVDCYAILHRAEKALKELKDAVKEQAINEAKDRDDGTLEAYGYRVSTYVRPTYVWKKDSVWVDLSRRRKERQDLLKDAVKMSRNGKELTDTETGEVIEPIPVNESENIRLTNLEK